MMEQVFRRPESLTDLPFHFCPGCHHGISHRHVAEAIDFFKVREKTIGVASVGCPVFLYDYFNIDVLEAPHGRASAVAAGVKRARKDRIVFTYQGMRIMLVGWMLLEAVCFNYRLWLQTLKMD